MFELKGLKLRRAEAVPMHLIPIDDETRDALNHIFGRDVLTVTMKDLYEKKNILTMHGYDGEDCYVEKEDDPKLYVVTKIEKGE